MLKEASVSDLHRKGIPKDCCVLVNRGRGNDALAPSDALYKNFKNKKRHLLKHVWGYDILVNNRSVDRCINTLRNKIEKNPDSPVFIKTIRDVGYRFEC